MSALGGGGMVNPMTLPGGFASDLSAYCNNSDCLPILLKYSGKGDFTRREILLFSYNYI